MSKEHISTLPLNIELTSRYHHYFREKLCCIICNASLDIYTKEHACILRPKNTDVVIHSKNVRYL
jgi:hypothetical protein